MKTSLTLRIIYPASPGQRNRLTENLKKLSQRGYTLRYDPAPTEASSEETASAEPSRSRLPWFAGTRRERGAALSQALLEPGTDVVLCARGGYGVSELLPELPWAKLRRSPPRLVVGFSDISALHSALYSQLGWPGVHGPMPDSDFWGQNGEHSDLEQLFSLLEGRSSSGSISIAPALSSAASASCEGWLFGGCLSVLCNLIGTPYFPRTLKGAILFFEDVDEPAGRLLRYWSQLLQSGCFSEVGAIILGQFRGLRDLSATELHHELALRSPCPVFVSEQFGHCSPNYPLPLGARALLRSGRCAWSLPHESSMRKNLV